MGTVLFLFYVYYIIFLITLFSNILITCKTEVGPTNLMSHINLDFLPFVGNFTLSGTCKIYER